LQVFFDHDLVRRMRHHQGAQVTLVCIVPARFTGVPVAETQELRFELLARPPQIVHRIRAGAAQIAKRLVCRFRNVDRREVAGPMQPRQFERVATVVLLAIPRLLGDERGRHHLAIDLQLQKPPRDPEAAPARFIANPQLLALLLEPRHDSLQGPQIVGDRAAGADFPIPAVLRHGDGNSFFMDIQSDEEQRFTTAFVCLVFHTGESLPLRRRHSLRRLYTDLVPRNPRLLDHGQTHFLLRRWRSNSRGHTAIMSGRAVDAHLLRAAAAVATDSSRCPPWQRASCR
jgi:hypothetical protein